MQPKIRINEKTPKQRLINYSFYINRAKPQSLFGKLDTTKKQDIGIGDRDRGGDEGGIGMRTGKD
jgi:hypothetical protein